jgi:hypothetical protein
VQCPGLRQELISGFLPIGIIHTGVHRAHRHALLLVVEPDALGALVRNDVIVLIGEGRKVLAVEFVLFAAGVNRFVGALGFTSAAIDALFVGFWSSTKN